MSNVNKYLPDTVAELVSELGLIPHPEGGFFLETFRSGSVPMSSRGQTDVNVPERDLVLHMDRRRNALTSIYWVPTCKSPMQPLTENVSDHVHYYQGGLPFTYIVYDKETKKLTSSTLGPDIRNGHVLQLPVKGGTWKCGGQNPASAHPDIKADYSIIAEAVGPGFDFHDFRFVQEDEVDKIVADEEIKKVLKRHLHRAQSMDELNEHYEADEAQIERAKERM